MEIKDIPELMEFSKENFIPKQVHVGEKSVVMLLCFDAKQEMPVHQHPGAVEMVIYGLMGQGKLLMGDEEREFNEGSIAFCKGDVPISPRNPGDGKFAVLVTMVLKREKT
ncbi:MAG: cupin domain-containing protein [Syntrophobacterales bacterium]|nr:MAG: cupin domain-containing protein [Syntrophobacterales bacterium]